MATQSWLQDEVAKLRKELAAARAELYRLRAAQRDPDATLNSSRKSAFCKRGSANVRFAPESDPSAALPRSVAKCQFQT